MAVRVKLRLRGSRVDLATSALVNSSYEAEEPELAMPR